MRETCDLCHSSALEPIYEPAASRQGLMVYLCSHCGLFQSLPRTERTARHAAAVSAADCNKIHSSSALPTDACLSLIRAHADLASSLCVLHTGSNRGSFARALLTAVPAAILTSAGADEHVRLPEAHFDIVYSCRTIAQRPSPASTLADHWRALKPDGLLIIDAPNVARIGSGDIAEEWFIDNQLYHFSRGTLTRLLQAAGFEIVAEPDSQDQENLLFTARKRNEPAHSAARDYAEVDEALTLITSYVITRANAQRAA